MEKNVFRKLSIYLAFIQMFSGGIKAFADAPTSGNSLNTRSNETSWTSELVLYNDNNPDNLIYKRVNPETGEYENISILDNENISSKQYGADQSIFRRMPIETLNDPLVWVEVQKDFPFTDYKSKDEALLRYDKLFKLISKVGCGYAAVADFVFRIYEGNEEGFFKNLGFPMYRVNGNFVDFNYELLMYKFFIYKNKKQFGSLDELKKLIEHQIAEDKLAEAKRQQSFMKRSFQEMKKWSKEQWDDYNKIYVPLRDTIKECEEILSEEVVDDNQFALQLEKRFGNLKDFLAQFGINISIGIQDGLKGTKPDNILARNMFTLYKIDENGEICDTIEDIKEHYVYVTGVTADGEFIVSSLGDKCLMDDEAEWTTKVILSYKK